MRKKFKIYLPFASNEVKRSMSYRASFYLLGLISVFGSFISYYLWMAIYRSSSGNTLGGLSKNEMILYIFMVFITSNMVTISISDWISEDIVKGSVSMNLIKPIDYRISLIAQAAGKVLFRFFWPSIFIWIGLEVYRVCGLHMKPVSLGNILLFLVSMVLSFLIYVLFDFCFAMIAFFTTYIFGLLMVKDAVLSFLTGQLIPLSFFPGVVRKIFDFLPFSSMIYTPVMMYLGKYKGMTLVCMLGRQVFWVLFLYFLGTLIWKKVTSHLVILGG